MGRTLNADGAWAKAVRTATSWPGWADSVTTESGRVYMALEQTAAQGSALLVATRAANGPWTKVMRLLSPADIATVGLVPSGPDSVLMHHMVVEADMTRTMWWMDLSADGSHTEPAPMPGIPGGWTGGDVTGFAGRDGGVALMWADRAGIHWLPRAANGQWGEGAVLGTARFAGDAAQLADGRWVVVWKQGRIVRRVQRADGSWTAAKAISDRKAAGPQVAAGPRGGFAVAWNRDLRLQATHLP